MVGLTTSLGSGLPFGKEVCRCHRCQFCTLLLSVWLLIDGFYCCLFQGPFVHIASIVATLLSKWVISFRDIYEVLLLPLLSLSLLHTLSLLFLPSFPLYLPLFSLHSPSSPSTLLPLPFSSPPSIPSLILFLSLSPLFSFHSPSPYSLLSYPSSFSHCSPPLSHPALSSLPAPSLTSPRAHYIPPLSSPLFSASVLSTPYSLATILSHTRVSLLFYNAIYCRTSQGTMRCWLQLQPRELPAHSLLRLAVRALFRSNSEPISSVSHPNSMLQVFCSV